MATVEVRGRYVVAFVHEDGRRDFSLKESEVIEKFPDVTFLPVKGSHVFVTYQGTLYKGEVTDLDHCLDKDLVVVKVDVLNEV